MSEKSEIEIIQDKVNIITEKLQKLEDFDEKLKKIKLENLDKKLEKLDKTYKIDKTVLIITIPFLFTVIGGVIAFLEFTTYDKVRNAVHKAAEIQAITEATKTAVVAAANATNAANEAEGKFRNIKSMEDEAKTALPKIKSTVELIVPDLQNDWKHYSDSGGPYDTVGYYKDNTGRVHLKGLVRAHKPNPGTIFTLIEGFRPQHRQLHVVLIYPNKLGRVDLLPNGDVLFKGFEVEEKGWVSLTGISFFPEQ